MGPNHIVPEWRSCLLIINADQSWNPFIWNSESGLPFRTWYGSALPRSWFSLWLPWKPSRGFTFVPALSTPHFCASWSFKIFLIGQYSWSSSWDLVTSASRDAWSVLYWLWPAKSQTNSVLQSWSMCNLHKAKTLHKYRLPFSAHGPVVYIKAPISQTKHDCRDM